MRINISLSKNPSISEFQKLIFDIYGQPDDRLFSIHDLLSNQEKFTMRAIKGIRKNDKHKLENNLIIAFSWIMAISNRLHINLDAILWRRFPALCSYCGKKPCVCKKIKIIQRVKIKRITAHKPSDIASYQKMFDEIYPSDTRSLIDSGIHLAEEMGEVSEAIHVFLGEHKEKQFIFVENEISDWISCMFGVANSASINISDNLVKYFSKNCHVCHKAPCECKFSFVAEYKS